MRCDGANPCRPCVKAAIRCAYLQVPKKKGPKGLRSSRVLHALRDTELSLAYAPAQATVHAQDYLPPLERQWSLPDTSGANPSFGRSRASTMPASARPQGLFQNVGPEVQNTLVNYSEQTLSPAQIADYGSATFPHTWSAVRSESSSPANFSSSATTRSRLCSATFVPYVKLFFEHLYPIMPVLDRHKYLESDLLLSQSLLASDEYALLCALCAATIVQLDADTAFPSTPVTLHQITADYLALESIRERQEFDFIDSQNTTTVMTSFFLFSYFGNMEKGEKAWYYLQECISFAQSIGLDNEDAIETVNPVEKHWWRRLYWLLFVTERQALPRLKAGPSRIAQH